METSPSSFSRLAIVDRKLTSQLATEIPQIDSVKEKKTRVFLGFFPGIKGKFCSQKLVIIVIIDNVIMGIPVYIVVVMVVLVVVWSWVAEVWSGVVVESMSSGSGGRGGSGERR